MNNIVRLFEARKSHIDYRIKRDYIRNGIAVIPCQISSYNDIISTYSVKGYETLNPEFDSYLKTAADVTPAEYPLLLNIVGDCLSQEEKRTIEETIREESAYNLGIVEKEKKRHNHIFFFMFIGLLISWIILWITKPLAEEPRELFVVLFWFMGYTLCDYIFLAEHNLRMNRRLAGRLASIKVIFSAKFEDSNYTESDVEQLYSEIEKDVKRTIKGVEE